MQPGLIHCFLEKHAVFGNTNGFAFSANHLDSAFGKHSRIIECQREIQGSLPADSWQQRVWSFLANDGADGFDGEWFDVSNVCRFRVGHDRGGIGVDQYNFIAFLTQSLARLRSGIVKLAGLSNNNWTRSDN